MPPVTGTVPATALSPAVQVNTPLFIDAGQPACHGAASVAYDRPDAASVTGVPVVATAGGVAGGEAVAFGASVLAADGCPVAAAGAVRGAGEEPNTATRTPVISMARAVPRASPHISRVRLRRSIPAASPRSSSGVSSSVTGAPCCQPNPASAPEPSRSRTRVEFSPARARVWAAGSSWLTTGNGMLWNQSVRDGSWPSAGPFPMAGWAVPPTGAVCSVHCAPSHQRSGPPTSAGFSYQPGDGISNAISYADVTPWSRWPDSAPPPT